MEELCVGYLARNFMLATSSGSFVCLPYKLLVSCLKHPHLTVESEMNLSDALLIWLDANRERLECFTSNENDCTNILRQIRLNLLPLWFASGKRKSCHFSELAEESINTIFSLMNTPSTSLVNIFGDSESHLPRLRLTEYSKKVNLSGCPQITVGILHAVLPSTRVNTVSRKGTNQSISDIEYFDRKCPIPRGIVQILSFGSVQEVDISNCPRLHVGAAVECFNQSFPSLRRLKAAYHSNFKIIALGQLVQMCPLVCEVDLTVDSSPVIPTKVSVISSSPATESLSEYGYRSRLSLSNITKLIFKGRTDVYDSDLMEISRSCLSLSYLNLKDCMSITDTGISNIISGCIKLHSLIVCNTSFGTSSISSLCSRVPEFSRFPDGRVENKYLESLASRFQKLHMGGCKDVDETSLLGFLSQAQTLRSLFLMDTHLSDRALLGFSGSSLEVLDVSNTKVISDHIVRNIMESLRQLRELTLCYCLGDISILSFQVRTQNLRKLRLERVAPWMTNDDLVLLTQNCSNLVNLSLIGCKLLNSDAQQIISHGWPGLISLHLEECGKVTAEGVSSLFDCKALEDLLLRHNGAGIERPFISDAASKLPMLRKLSLDSCDSVEGYFYLPNFADKYFLSYVKIARCKARGRVSSFQLSPVHKETLVVVWDNKKLITTMVKERI